MISCTDSRKRSLRVRWWQACTRPVRATTRERAISSSAVATRPGTNSSPVEKPAAPSSRACARRRSIPATSSGRASRSSEPITALRIAACPTRKA